MQSLQWLQLTFGVAIAAGTAVIVPLIVTFVNMRRRAGGTSTDVPAAPSAGPAAGDPVTPEHLLVVLDAIRRRIEDAEEELPVFVKTSDIHVQWKVLGNLEVAREEVDKAETAMQKGALDP